MSIIVHSYPLLKESLRCLFSLFLSETKTSISIESNKWFQQKIENIGTVEHESDKPDESEN